MALSEQKIDELVDEAYQYAVTNPLSGDVEIESPTSLRRAAGRNKFHDDLAQCGDYAQLVDYAKEPYPLSGNQVLVDTLDELQMVYRALYVLTPLVSAFTVVNSVLEHEAAHGAASMFLGYKRVQYGVTMRVSNTGDKFGVQPFTAGLTKRTITKLEFAAIMGVPEHPSEGDEHILSAIGYQGVQDVAKRISIHNTRYPRDRIPTLLSVR